MVWRLTATPKKTFSRLMEKPYDKLAEKSWKVLGA